MKPELATGLAGRIRIEAQVESTGGLVKVEAMGLMSDGPTVMPV
jgi:hypothetical protein